MLLNCIRWTLFVGICCTFGSLIWASTVLPDGRWSFWNKISVKPELKEMTYQYCLSLGVIPSWYRTITLTVASGVERIALGMKSEVGNRRWGIVWAHITSRLPAQPSLPNLFSLAQAQLRLSQSLSSPRAAADLRMTHTHTPHITLIWMWHTAQLPKLNYECNLVD